ncbi:hypothetical protein CORC01_04503, partial [Colletotrichum orchidophilum]
LVRNPNTSRPSLIRQWVAPIGSLAFPPKPKVQHQKLVNAGLGTLIPLNHAIFQVTNCPLGHYVGRLSKDTMGLCTPSRPSFAVARPRLEMSRMELKEVPSRPGTSCWLFVERLFGLDLLQHLPS